MDELDRRLKDLSESIGEHTTSPEPTPEIVQRARRRRLGRLVGSSGLVVLMAIGSYAGIDAYRDNAPALAGPDRLAQAAAATEAAGSARFYLETTTKSVGDPADTTTGEGLVDFVTGHSHMRYETLARTSTFVHEVITFDSTSYTKSRSPTDANAKWVKREGVAESSFGTRQGTPSLDELRSFGDEIEVLGNEEVRGIETTHYRGSVDVNDLFGGEMEDIPGIEVNPSPFEVWIDEQNLVRRMTFDIEMSGTMSGTEIEMSVSSLMEFYDFGIDVNVQPPPEDQVISEEEADLYPSGSTEGEAFDEATQAINSGALDEARVIGQTTLDAADDPDDWNYGNLIHRGNLILGHVALREGDVTAAKKYLLEAGRTPGSPQLNSFGPNMSLARDLLLADETDAVKRYFELCSQFWELPRGRLDTWMVEVQSGEIPDFGANLVYGGLGPDPIEH